MVGKSSQALPSSTQPYNLHSWEIKEYIFYFFDVCSDFLILVKYCEFHKNWKYSGKSDSANSMTAQFMITHCHLCERLLFFSEFGQKHKCFVMSSSKGS